MVTATTWIPSCVFGRLRVFADAEELTRGLASRHGAADRAGHQSKWKETAYQILSCITCAFILQLSRGMGMVPPPASTVLLVKGCCQQEMIPFVLLPRSFCYSSQLC